LRRGIESGKISFRSLFRSYQFINFNTESFGKVHQCIGGEPPFSSFNIADGGTFTMKGDASVYGNTTSFWYGGGVYNNGTASHGTYSGDTWNSNGNLSSTDNTIRVVGGMLIQ
jgi:hypothetical protein